MTKKIETLAVSILNEELSYNGYLSSYVQDGDRTPLNDGFIYIYNSKSHSNKTLYGQVLTQVKGKTIKNNDFKTTYSFKKEYIEYFRKYGGIFFVVFINIETRESFIYYRSLTQADCKVLLDIMKKNNNKSKSFDLCRFPKSKSEQVKLLRSIEHNSRKQGNAIIEENFYIEDINKNIDSKEYKLVLYPQIKGADNYNYQVFKELSKSRNQIYMRNIKHGLPFVLQPTINRAIRLEEKLEISVDGKVYFDDAKFMFNEGDEYLYISDNISIPITSEDREKETVDWTFSFDDNSFIREKELSFILNSINNKSYNVNDIKVDFNIKMNNFQLENLNTEFENTKKINDVLRKYKIDSSVQISKLNNNDYMHISFLTDGKIHKDNLHNISENNNIGYMVFNIANIKILTILVKKDNNYFYIKDPHESDLEILTNNNNPTHIYHFINTYDYDSNNLFPEIIFENIKKIYNVKDDIIVYSLNTLLLNLITYYDEYNGDIKKDIITLMKNLSELMNASGELGDKLNYLQIKKRIDEISEEDKLLLLAMLKDDNIEIKFAASVLLEDRENANKYFNAMIKEKQEFYKKLPIYKIYRQL